MPGLVNAHTHVPMTLLRGLADDLRLDVWLMGFMMPVERQFVSPEFVRLGTQIACLELIRSGVTCFADMYYFEEHVARATAEIGLRAVCAQIRAEIPHPGCQFLRGVAGRCARFHRQMERSSLDRPFRRPARRLYLHRRNLASHRRAGARIRCPAADPHRRDCAGSGEFAQRIRHAGRALSQEAPAFRGQGAGSPLRPYRRRRDEHAAALPRRCGPQPFLEPEAGLRFCPGQQDAGDRPECRHRHRWPGIEQRPGYVRRNPPGSLAGQECLARPHRRAGAHRAEHGNPAGRQCAAYRRYHRVAGAGQARRSDPGRPFRSAQLAALSTRPERALRPAGLHRQIERCAAM